MSEKDLGEGTLYEHARATIAKTPEEIEVFDQEFQTTLANLIKTHGEEKALAEMNDFLKKTFVEVHGAQALIDLEEKLKKGIEASEKRWDKDGLVPEDKEKDEESGTEPEVEPKEEEKEE